MKIPVLAKNVYENFYSVIKIWKKKKTKKDEPLLSELPCKQNKWTNYLSIFRGSEL